MILPENGKLIKDPITIAAIMNDYFTDMTRTVGRKGPQSNHETIVLIGTTCKKNPLLYYSDSICRRHIAKRAVLF